MRELALVTGGSSGIGAAVAKELANKGYHVLVNYPTDAQKLDAEKIVSQIDSFGRSAEALCFDVASSGEVENAFKTISSKDGELKVLVNNAGITRDTLVMRMKDSDWESVIKINLQGAFNCCRSAVKLMARSNSASIINISSVVGLHGNAGQSNYAASKAGLLGLTYSLAKEYASRGIRVNAVAPGYIETAMTSALREDYIEAMKKATPLGRAGLPEDVAKAVSFLAGNDSSFITGQVLVVDGGMSI